MIPKVLESGYNDSGAFPPSEIIPAFSKGLDRQLLKKRASMFADVLPNFERRPGHTYIHLIAVADGGTYGPNSRADYYNGEPCEVEIVAPKERGVKVIKLDGGIEKYLPTFLENGGVYTEHRNKHSANPPKSQGYIVAQAYNQPMKRGELIIGVNDDAWQDDLEGLANGKPMKFSIGFDAVHDICSECGNVAHTEDEHCDHIKHHAGEWDKDGNVICMISDKGVYHDISRVRVPAERIAFSIKKVAAGAEEPLLPSVNPYALRCMLKTAAAVKRYDTVQKLAKIEKKILAEGSKLNKELLKGFALRKHSSDSALDELHKFINFAQSPEVFGGLKERHCVLDPEEFLQLLAPEMATPKNIKIIRIGLPGIFNDIWQRPDLDMFCEDDAYTSRPCTDMRIIRPLSRLQDQTCVNPLRLMESMLSSGDDNKKEYKITLCIERKPNDLAREYASYFADACSTLSDEEQVLALLRALTQSSI